MGPIIAIGGGEIADAETESIDRHAIETAAGTTPHALFVPTASGDAEAYVEKFEPYYEGLGCEVSTLQLTDPQTTVADARTAIDAADIIYVGGGDTGYLVDTIRSFGLRDDLIDHHRDGGVLTGLSAGALCWFEYTLSDAIALEDVSHGPTAGLGLVTGLHATVHADFRRREAFRRYLERRNEPGVALGDCAALEIIDGQYRVHTSSPNGFVYHVDPRAENPVWVLSEGDEFSPVSELRDPK